MTARTSTVLKANFDDRDPADQMDDVIDTMHNPQSAVTFAGAVTLASTVTLSAGATVANGQDIVAATSGGSDLGSATGEWGDVYVGDSKGVTFGADQDNSIKHDGTTGLDVSLADNDSGALRVYQGSTDYIAVNTGNNVERVEIGAPLDIEAGIDRSVHFQIWDDFIQQTLTEADGPWIENSGTHAVAADPAISAQENGVVRLTTGTADGTVASNGSQIVGHIPVQADSGGLFFETRLHINTAITSCKLNAGFTDATTLELPFSISTGTYTSTATDAALFVLDFQDYATTAGSWHTVSVDTNVDDSGCDAVASGPTADTYQTLRIEVSVGGGTCWYFIDGALVNTLSNTGVTPNTNLYPTVIASGGSWAQRTVDIDYITFGHTRS